MNQRVITFNPLWTKFLALGMAGAMIAACGSSSKDSGKTTTKKAPDTYLTEQKVENGTATFKYASNDTKATFKCRTLVNGQPTTDWQACPNGSLTVALPASGQLTFEVKAIAADGTEDPIPYSVAVGNGTGTGGQAATFVQGAQALQGQTLTGQAKYQTISMTMSQPGATTYKAFVDNNEVSWLVQGTTMSFNVMQLAMVAGNHTLRVDAMNGTQAVAQQSITFCVDQCSQGQGGGSQQGFQSLMVGPYTVTPPTGMHVTEYVSTSNMYNMPNLYTMLPNQDPFYTPIQTCLGTYGSQAGTTEQVGAFSYCHSTMLAEMFKVSQDYRLAFNHVEIATDAAYNVQGSLPNYENVMINVFNNTVEFMNSTSRFKHLCGTRPVTPLSNIPMIAGFYMGQRPQSVTFWSCDTYIQGPLGQAMPVKVGAFFDVDTVNAANFWTCQSGCPAAADAIEMVYVKVPDGYDVNNSYFARRAQERILNALARLPIN